MDTRNMELKVLDTHESKMSIEDAASALSRGQLPKEVPVTEGEMACLQAMNRRQRRAWLKDNRKMLHARIKRLAPTVRSEDEIHEAVLAKATEELVTASDPKAVQHDGCNYFAVPGHICTRCGQMVEAPHE